MNRNLTDVFHAQQQAVERAPFPPLSTRRERLTRLARMTKRHQHDIVRAIQADFGQRSEVEIHLAEISAVTQAIGYTRHRLRSWMRPKRAGVPWRLLPARARVEPQPLGVVGIVSPWNYPWSLALMPAIDAFAAGNVVMLKPSERTAHTSALLAKLIPQYFTQDEFSVVEGGEEVAEAFCSLPFDHLVFTGSFQVGKRVALAAAANLTPVTLELGGKSPAIVAGDADLDRAAAAIIFGKGLNAGQTCIAPDYVLVESRRLEDMIQALTQAIAHQRPSDKEATSAISEHHQQRMDWLIEEARDHGCRIIDSGSHAPALIIDPTQTLAVMREEIFGRCLPVIGVKDTHAAIDYVNARPHPLALYAFTDNKALQLTLRQHTRSGALVFNETLLHHAVPSLPFGGVGNSGIGAYHGRCGFERFSHLRSTFYQAKQPASRLIRPPYRRWLMKLLRLG
ncbi:aldehyde dehydrogenase family protein [Vreelandella olivaria]|uniref:aldehyde dehydrogenase family protein n=1 Tax=Vreelandella olivaria TaxID=390919 RepID=UPI00201F3E28|nr:aldehyde dehydrogenase family protein [Halomonas olivaria]